MSPLVANTVAMTNEDDTIFFFGTWSLGDSGIEVIMPTFTTLFTNAACMYVCVCDKDTNVGIEMVGLVSSI